MGLTIDLLHLGDVQIDSSLLVRYNPPGVKARVPTWSYLIRGGSDGPVLVDTGFRDPTWLELVGMTVCGDPEINLETELARCGLRPADIRYIIHTHLHGDHAGKDSLFPLDTTVVINRRELELAAGAGTWAYPPEDTKHLIDRLYTPGAARLLDLAYSGPVEILPGIVCDLAGGHTEGSVNVRVETDDGPATICGDLIYSVQEQLVHPTLPLQQHEYRITGHSEVSPAQEKGAVKKLVSAPGWLLPMHDQPARIGRGGLVLGRLAGRALPGPLVPVLRDRPDGVAPAEADDISAQLVKGWVC
jgi:glyoxylase-like metal-dependent hydrolase (beta-lactamase superfamily II)